MHLTRALAPFAALRPTEDRKWVSLLSLLSRACPAHSRLSAAPVPWALDSPEPSAGVATAGDRCEDPISHG